jgi:carbon storage regulator CsrA
VARARPGEVFTILRIDDFIQRKELEMCQPNSTRPNEGRGLVLSRGVGETIDLMQENGETITVTVTDVRPGSYRCRLQIKAPNGVRILRRELTEALQQDAVPNERIHAA